MRYADPLTVARFAAIPYILVTWGYTKLTGGDTKAFWVALGALLGIRLFFLIIETLGDVLSWRLYRRGIAVGNAIAFLKANGYPPRKYSHDDFLNYLARIQGDSEYPETLRTSALQMERILAAFEQLGILGGARAWTVFDAALDLYAPKTQATHRLS